MLLGFFLAVATYFPLFESITHFANPALEAALATSPVVVVADPAECHFQFNPLGTAKFTSSCDIAKAALVNRSVNYRNEAAPPLASAKVRVGGQLISTTAPDFTKVVNNAVTVHSYPTKADPSQISRKDGGDVARTGPYSRIFWMVHFGLSAQPPSRGAPPYNV